MAERTYVSYEEREALKQELFSTMHCALHGSVVAFDAEKQTADVRPAVKMGLFGKQ